MIYNFRAEVNACALGGMYKPSHSIVGGRIATKAEILQESQGLQSRFSLDYLCTSFRSSIFPTIYVAHGSLKLVRSLIDCN